MAFRPPAALSGARAPRRARRHGAQGLCGPLAPRCRRLGSRAACSAVAPGAGGLRRAAGHGGGEPRGAEHLAAEQWGAKLGLAGDREVGEGAWKAFARRFRYVPHGSPWVFDVCCTLFMVLQPFCGWIRTFDHFKEQLPPDLFTLGALTAVLQAFAQWEQAIQLVRQHPGPWPGVEKASPVPMLHATVDAGERAMCWEASLALLRCSADMGVQVPYVAWCVESLCFY